jgi:hypothetical protein
MDFWGDLKSTEDFQETVMHQEIISTLEQDKEVEKDTDSVHTHLQENLQPQFREDLSQVKQNDSTPVEENINSFKNSKIDLSEIDITQFAKNLYNNINEGKDLDSKTFEIMKRHIKDAMDKTFANNMPRDK